MQALALFDSGSSINAMHPDFAVVAQLSMFDLEKPIPLQLGCAGSRSNINHGTITDVQLGKTTAECYFNVVNLDHYDVILGVPFLSDNRVLLDFQNEVVLIGKEGFPSLPVGEEVATAKPRSRINKTAAKYDWAIGSKPE